MVSRRNFIKTSALAGTGSLLSVDSRDIFSTVATTVDPPEGWTTASPREEIKPKFSYDPHGGADHKGSFNIESDQREGLIGRWTKTFPVKGGKHYRFSVMRKFTGTNSPVPKRRAGIVRILWQDDKGKQVKHDESTVLSYLPGQKPTAEPEYPMGNKIFPEGWTEMFDTYLVPPLATQAIVELEFRWAPNARVEWSGVSLSETAVPNPRIVRLATVHFVPRDARSPEERRSAFVPMIEEAAKQKADLVVLPEVVTYGKGSTFVDVAEQIPGPSTEFFGALAKKHNLYLVPGLVEREKHLIYNVSVLISPEGKVIGKYRKICLPRPEIEGGITPGYEYPVFETRFGKVGMMICYDGFFPEIARELSIRGAEVIAWPVMGCNPLLAKARACENHVYIVSSTHTASEQNWMISAIFDHEGNIIKQAKEFGTIAIAEVNLDRRIHWNSLGDFKAEIRVHRPPDCTEQCNKI